MNKKLLGICLLFSLGTTLNKSLLSLTPKEVLSYKFIVQQRRIRVLFEISVFVCMLITSKPLRV